MAKIDLKLRFSIKSQFLPGRPRSEPTARPPPPPDRGLPTPDRGLITGRGLKIGHLRKILRPWTKQKVSYFGIHQFILKKELARSSKKCWFS